MKRKIFSVLLTLVLVLSFSLVTAVPAGAVEVVPDRATAVTNAADRLVALQSEDPERPGWNRDITGLLLHDPDLVCVCCGSLGSCPGIYGMTGLGLIAAYRMTLDEAYLTAAIKAAAYPHILGNRITFDRRFLFELSEISADPSYAESAIADWNVDLSGWSAENCYDSFRGPWGPWVGAAFWETSDWALEAFLFGDEEWARDAIALMLADIGDIGVDDPTRFVGWGHLLHLLQTVDPDTYAAEIADLVEKLENDQHPDGFWMGPNHRAQDTAYAIMGLASVDPESPSARRGCAWLVANQGYDGIIGGWKDVDGEPYECPGYNSEAIQALEATSAPVTIGDKEYYTIQQAIDSASAEDIIDVAAGTYNENLAIEKGLTLEGAQAGTDPTVEGVRKNPAEESIIDGNNVGNTITITASDVLVSGFTVTGGTYQNILAPFGGVVVDGNGGTSALTEITIEDNIVHGNDGNGIFVSAAGDGGAQGNIAIRRNKVYDNGLAVGTAGISLTYLWYGDCPMDSWDEWRRPKNILVEENDVHENNLYGIYLNSGKDCVIRTNELWGNSSKGLLLASSMEKCEIPSEYNLVEDNQIYNNAYNGIKLVSFNHHNTFTGNNIYGNGFEAPSGKDYFGYGFQFKDGNDNTLEDNTIHGNALGGLYLWGFGDPSYHWYSTTNNAIIGNTIYDHSAGYGIYIPSLVRPYALNQEWPDGYPNSGFLNSHINQNNITNNLFGIVNEDTTQTVDATSNWWGDATGPKATTNPSATGNEVSDYVEYTPWITGEVEPGAVDSADVSGTDPEVTLEDSEGGTIADVDISGGDVIQGTITAFRYTEEPAEETSLSVGTGTTSVVFLDVQVTGYTEGMATITVPYPDANNDGIVDGTTDPQVFEHTLGLYYWDEAGMWRLAANNVVDPDANTVSGDIPVSALTGTPIGLGGYEALVAIESILNLNISGEDTVELTIKTNTAFLGAATIDLIFDPSVVEVLGVEGVGEGEAFVATSAFDTLEVNLNVVIMGNTQVARFLAYQSAVAGKGVDATNGAVVAVVKLKAVGSTMDFSPLALHLETLKDNNLDRIPSTLGALSFALVGGVGDANRDTYIDPMDLVEIECAILAFPGYSKDTLTMNVDGKDDVDAADCTYLAWRLVADSPDVDYPLPPDGWVAPWAPPAPPAPPAP